MHILRTLLAVGITLAHTSAAGAIIFQDNFDGNLPGLSVVPKGGWTVSNGTVDIHGPGFFDLVPGNGLYVDLEGTKNAGVLSHTFNLTTPATYTATYTLAGSRLFFDPVNIVDVQFGSATSTHRLLADDGPSTYSLTFLPSAPGAATLTFSNQGVDDWGAFLLDVTVTGPVTEPPKPTYSFADVIRDSVRAKLFDIHNGNPKAIELAFRPNFGLALKEAAAVGGYEQFNWLSVVRSAPFGGPYPRADGVCDKGDRDCKTKLPFLGYDASPYYWEEQPGSGHADEYVIGHPYNTPDDYTLRFEDKPGFGSPFLPWDGTPPFLFNTFLVGVIGPFKWDLLNGWEWTSTNGGFLGGVLPPTEIFELGNLVPTQFDDGGVTSVREITVDELSPDVRRLLVDLGARNVPQGIPEPGTLALLMLALPFLVSQRRRSPATL